MAQALKAVNHFYKNSIWITKDRWNHLSATFTFKVSQFYMIDIIKTFQKHISTVILYNLYITKYDNVRVSAGKNLRKCIFSSDNWGTMKFLKCIWMRYLSWIFRTCIFFLKSPGHFEEKHVIDFKTLVLSQKRNRFRCISEKNAFEEVHVDCDNKKC